MNKKIIIGIVVLLFVVVLLVLFIKPNNKKVEKNNNEIVCKLRSDQSKNGYILDSKYVIEYKDNIVEKVRINEEVMSLNMDILDEFENQFNDEYSYSKKKYGGYTYEVVKSNDKVNSNVEIDYKVFNIEKFAENNEAIREYLNDNKLTIDGAKKMYEKSGFKCE